MPTEEELEVARRVAAEYAARRQIVEHTCEVCGKSFRGTTRARYCSSACRQRAHYRTARGLPIADAVQVEPAALLGERDPGAAGSDD